MVTESTTQKFYTPSIEEFHVGFDFQVNVYDHDEPNPIWTSEIFEAANFREIDFWHKEGMLRVKYLDHDDIVAEGWKDTKEVTPHELKIYNLYIDSDRHCKFCECQLIQSLNNWVLITEKEQTRFSGTIRNRSELRQIMRMLNIH